MKRRELNRSAAFTPASPQAPQRGRSFSDPSVSGTLKRAEVRAPKISCHLTSVSPQNKVKAMNRTRAIEPKEMKEDEKSEGFGRNRWRTQRVKLCFVASFSFWDSFVSFGHSN